MSTSHRAQSFLLTILLLLASSAPALASSGRVIHSFSADRARAHRWIDGHRLLVPGAAESRAFRTPRTRGLDYRLPTPRLEAVHIHYQRTGKRPRIAATVDGKHNLPLPPLSKTERSGVLSASLKAALKSGNHRIRLRIRDVKISWIALGSRARPASLGDKPPQLFRGRHGTKPESLLIPPGGRIGFYTQMPPGAELRLQAHTPKSAQGKRNLRIEALANNGKRHKLAKVTLSPGDTHSVTAPIGKLAEQALRVDFVLEGPGGPASALLRPQVVLPKVAKRYGKPPAPPKNVLIWLVDTLRPDRLSAYNPKTRVKSPNFSRLAKEGVVFESCVAQGNESITSHASLFTGQYPVLHRLTTPKRKLSQKLTLLPEAVKKAKGMYTMGLISNGYVSDRWGFGQGWNLYTNFIRENLSSKASSVWGRAKRALNKKVKNKRFFAYLGTIDPHVAYNAPKPFQRMYHPEKYRGRLRPQATGVFLDKWKARGKKPALTAADKKFLVALYEGEVTYNDDIFGKMLDYLDEKGLAQDTLIVVTADHGEEFFEHGTVGHGHTVREVLTHIPLIVRWPGGIKGGQRVNTDVELIDVMPTILDLLQLPIPKQVQGASLAPLVLDPAPVMPRPAISFHGGVRSAKLGRYKYVLLSKGERLYDLRKDPFEHKDVAAKNPVVLSLMREAVSLHRLADKRWRKGIHGIPISPTEKGARLLLAPLP